MLFKKKTHKEFADQMKVINAKIEIRSEYNGSKKPIQCKCVVCGYEWETTPDNLLVGSGCHKCSKVYRRTQDDFIREMQEKNPDICLIGKYTRMKTKTTFACKVCGHQWEAMPNDMIHGNYGLGNKCPKCSDHVKRTPEKFIEDMREINPDIIIVGDYTGLLVKIKCQCNKCGFEWDSLPTNLLRNHGCPICRESLGEKKIKKALEKSNIKFAREKRFDDCRNLKPLPFDFYLPDENILIEFDGRQHFEPVSSWGGEKGFELIKKNDKIKSDYCKENGIKLIRIPYKVKNIEEYLNIKISISN